MKNPNDIHKNMVQMDIRADGEGYVYFNELLYKVMKKTYGIKHIRNKKLADYEANTFIKINKLQEKMSKQLISEEKKAIAVNPFLAIMHYKISFKTWLHYTKKKYEKEAKNDNMAGSEDSNEDLSESDDEEDNVYMHSEYSYQTFEVESMGSSSAHLSNDESFDSGIDTIIEHEAEENEKDNLDASANDIQGKRLFVDEEEEKSLDEHHKSEIKDEVHSDTEQDREGIQGVNKILGNSTLERRKSSAPDNVAFVSPRFHEKQSNENLKIIEENKDELTISMDAMEI